MPKLVAVLVLAVLCQVVIAADRITGTINFHVFNRDLKEWIKLSDDDADFVQNECNAAEKFAIVVHGWREGFGATWVSSMLSNMTTYRDGCVIFMNYGDDNRYMDYFGELVPHFNQLTNALLHLLRRMTSIGFDPAEGLLFGFSFGAHLSLEAGRRFGLQRLGRIDACDPAGPGFDDATYYHLDPKQAAKRVQCIHTSATFGSSRRDCHVSWSMGKCGKEQAAARPYPNGSHGLCPQLYTSAFKHNFYAGPKPDNCQSNRYASSWPPGFKMGYFCDMESGAYGEFFSPTTKYFPFNDENVLNAL